MADDSAPATDPSYIESLVQSIRDSLKIGHGLRGQQIDAEVDRITRQRDGQSSDSSQ